MISKRFFKSVTPLKFVAAVAVFAAILSSCGLGKPVETATRTTFQMNTVITFSVTGHGAEQVCDDMIAAIDDFEKAASMQLANSDVSRINDSAGQGCVEIDAHVYEVITRAKQHSRDSGGLFDTTIGPLTSLWDVTSGNPRVPSEDEIEAAKELVDYNSILLPGETNTVGLEKEGQMLDLGATKGYALDICREIMDAHGVAHGLISIGGNVMVYNDKDGKPFSVGIRYPEKDSEGYFCALSLTDTIVSTTGGYERYFEYDGILYHHVIDPRTGYPSDSGLLSVSVVGRDGLDADCLSTAMFVGGLDYCRGLMNRGVEAIIVDADNNVYISKSLEGKMIDTHCDNENYNFMYI